MKRLLPIIVVLFVVLLAGVWWMSRGSPVHDEPVSSGPSAPLASTDGDPEEAALTGPASSAPAKAPALETSSATPVRDERVSVEEDRRRAALERALVVRGRIAIPAGCTIAGDETTVYAAVRALTNEELATRIQGDPAREPDASRDLALSDPDAAFPFIEDGPPEDEDAEPEGAPQDTPGTDLVARARVADDGTFELALEPDHARVWLVLSGRRLYSAAAVEVDPRAGGEVALTARCGAMLGGRFVAPQGTSAGTVELRLRTEVQGAGVNPDQFVSRRAEAALDGRYEFRALPAAGPMVMLVESEDLAASRFEVSPLAVGEEREQDLVLLSGARVRGRVVDDAGLPVAGAEVDARESGRFFGFDDRELREAETDADGRFELEHVLPGKVMLVAEADGYIENEGVKVELVDGETHEGSLLELGRGAAIAGRVTWPDGSPAAEADVDVEFDLAHLAGMGAFNARRGAEGEGEADADGRFRVTGLGKGPFTVKATARPAEGETRHRARADGVQPNELELVLVLEPPIGLAGRVVSAHDGTPVTAFEVSGHEASDGLLGPLGKEKAEDEFEDGEGRFFLEGLRAGAWTFRVRAEGFAVSEPVETTLPQAEDAELVIELQPEVRVKGTVVSPSGAPVAGATVRVDTGQPVWREQIDEATGFGSPRAESGGDGGFELAGLAPGTHALFARAEEWARSEAVNVDLAQGEDVEGVTLVLRAGGMLTGEVWNDEEPAAGFFVQLTRMETFDQRVAFVDAEGRFEVAHLEEGTWQVVAMSSSGAGLAAPDDGGDGSDDEGAAAFGDMMANLKMTITDVVEDEVTHVVLGAPAADPVKVHGRVTHSGTPYSGAIVTFYAEGENVMETMRNTTVSKEGGYSVDLARPGQYVIQIQKIGAMGQQRLVEFTRLVPSGTTELELDFEIPIGRVSGRVEDSSGAPAGSVRVSLHPEGALETGTLWGGQYAETTTDRDGRFDIEGLRPGRYSLMAGGAAFGATVGSVHGRVARSIRLGEGEWLRDEDFRLPEASKVKVKVVDASGKPVAEAAVFARDAAGHLLDRLSMITTDAGGHAEYAGLGEGRYSLAARKEGLASLESAPIELGEGDAAEVELRMQPGTMLVITLVGDGEELLNAHVSVRDADGNEVNGMISLADLTKQFGQGFSTKEQKVGPLPPGKYVVEATGPNGEKVKKPVTLSGQSERKLRLELE